MLCWLSIQSVIILFSAANCGFLVSNNCKGAMAHHASRKPWVFTKEHVLRLHRANPRAYSIEKLEKQKDALLMCASRLESEERVTPAVAFELKSN